VYDVIVIGGGTGGLSFIAEARKLGLSVALFDYVEPSPQ
jgi:pyruvate/2-oxoglutarate dehydrogenase complex dihydrolipoamide dehydrogenase (E3) component